ncbi:amino acid/amide ABC transporter ATP-binding protein 2, HAAT family [Palleronia marisminoris]|uniref:High-affinity branched-chain amino acid transport ATP-binding protein LivF n=1 Tax=Palleronia marisminoris TaxID=315423 RepID=A0A1Y5TQ94_9RHOB|nr:ABC transporter ATP-binding protein [Palleronia marisminoris]SFH42110.1 amino acid/amide ABC transporter ATP-binding protein 2, HAAT family [Palleronia marisminoris]SLN65656.1 High-affinity branched-chain amino acid transport ATP-binding protein LivF [Palleronia marisminoris]
MLEVEGLEAAYGESRILFGIDLTVRQGEVVTLLGRNGMGKTTTIKSIFGMLKPRGGRVSVDGDDLTGAEPHRVALAGLGLVPEGRQIFPTLSVEENLRATARRGKWDLARIYDLFPRLHERRRNMGNQLSGGEQQMLAIGRALMTNPRLVVLDEATEGLAPLIRADIWACLTRIKAEGEAILVIDKNVDALTRFADRHVVIEKGRVVWTGTTPEILATPEVKDRFLHV